VLPNIAARLASRKPPAGDALEPLDEPDEPRVERRRCGRLGEASAAAPCEIGRCAGTGRRLGRRRVEPPIFENRRGAWRVFRATHRCEGFDARGVGGQQILADLGERQTIELAQGAHRLGAGQGAQRIARVAPDGLRARHDALRDPTAQRAHLDARPFRKFGQAQISGGHVPPFRRAPEGANLS
jgi:hypothetical protein